MLNSPYFARRLLPPNLLIWVIGRFPTLAAYLQPQTNHHVFLKVNKAAVLGVRCLCLKVFKTSAVSHSFVALTFGFFGQKNVGLFWPKNMTILTFCRKISASGIAPIIRALDF
jgi:hypothetical protein